MMVPFFVIIPLLAAFLISLAAARREGPAFVLATTATAALLILSVTSFFASRTAILTTQMSGWKLPYGITLTIDALAAFMLVIVAVISLTSLIYSHRYIKKLSGGGSYYSLFMLLFAGMNGVLITGDLFNLYVFMEIALLAAFALVAYGTRAEEFEAAFKYAVMGSVSSLLILVGIAVTYSATSNLNMVKIAQAVPALDPKLVNWIAALFLGGFGLKAAAMPFHAWLPDAHSSAPAPISAMLSGVLIKVLGIYVIIRLYFNLFGAPAVFLDVFLVLGAISIIFSGLLAIRQWDMKRLLAYSSISQIGYILLGIGLGTTLGILGALYHLLNHAIFKGLLFYNAGAVEAATGTRDLRNMGSIGRKLPVTSTTSLVASLAIGGIPPFNGFFSKVIIILAAVGAGHPVYALWAVIGSVLTLAAVMKLQRYSFGASGAESPDAAKVSLGMNAAMVTLAALCILASLLIIPGLREMTLDPVVAAVTQKAGYIQMVTGR